MTETEAFKNELRNYSWYEFKIKLMTERLDEMWYELSGVKGIDYSKEMGGGGNPEIKEERRLELIEKINQVDSERDYFIKARARIDSTLEQMSADIRRACRLIYIEGNSYYKVSMGLYMSPTSLFHAIEKEIEEIKRST